MGRRAYPQIVKIACIDDYLEAAGISGEPDAPLFYLSYRVADADAWLADAVSCAGSWWPDWINWLADYGGQLQPPPAAPGNDNYPAIEPAPGRYVRERCD